MANTDRINSIEYEVSIISMSEINNSKRFGKVGMKDIAKEAGVSISTVSLVFNEKPGISDEVRERVKAVAKSLGYEPKNRSISQANTYSIIFPASIDNLLQTESGNEIYDGYLDGFDAAAQELDVNITYIPNVEDSMGDLFIRLLENEIGKSRGIVLCSLLRTDSPVFSFLRTQDIPLVLLNRIVDEPDISYVSVDYYKATYHMVSQLIKGGCKKVIYIGSSSPDEILEKVKTRGYRAALEDNGIEIDESLIYSIKDINGIVEGVISNRGADSNPLGLYIISSNFVKPLKEAIEPLGLKIGRDLRVAGGEFLVRKSSERDFDVMDTVRLPYSEAAYHALKTVDFLARNPSITTVRMLLGWEYMPAKGEKL